MAKIINLQEATSIVTLRKKEAMSLVLVGGCFDILHIGHIKFLAEAKKMGDYLMVLLESDEKVKILKGKNRPLYKQQERAEVLSSIKYVDYVLLLPTKINDQDYDDLVLELNPTTIAVTANDPLLQKKKKQAKMIGAKIKIIPYIKTLSSSKLAKLLGVD